MTTATPASPGPSLPASAGPTARYVRVVLPLMVFAGGMTTMATEMAAARLLAPFFGQSIMVWANIIGLILIYLSVGYWWGGRLADRNPTASGLSRIALLAAASIAVVPFLASPVLDVAAGGVDAISAGAVVGSFAGTLLLFALPITLLGMVPPYAIRIGMDTVERAGHVAGSFYALSTIGSIVGTFGAVLITIPAIGTRRTMLLFAFMLALLATFGLARRWAGVAVAVVIALLALIPVGDVKAADGQKLLFEKDSRHQFVQVLEQPDGTRILQLNEGWAVHSQYHPDHVLVRGIWDHFALLPGVAGGASASSDQNMLIIGNAAGSASRAYAALYPDVHIDGVEIDPVVSMVGEEYFGMTNPNLDVHTADGRPYLARNEGPWDIILIDAYRQPYIPFYLTTQEFFQLVQQRLAPGGVVAINVGSTPGDDRIQDAIGGTMRSVFPSVLRYQAEEFNELILAFDRDVSPAEASAGLNTAVSHIRGSDLDATDIVNGEAAGRVAAEGMTAVERASAGRDLLTDDRAPIEWITDSMIVSYAREGGR